MISFRSWCLSQLLSSATNLVWCYACREDWLGQLIAELDDTDSYEYVKQLTDVHRLHLFDVVMQYRAIFFDGATAQVRMCLLWRPRLVQTSVLLNYLQGSLVGCGIYCNS
eukprot:GHUV01051308.1.p1 GENE.GHUV01051308.1~~GHUV01051308.1.p1  ORF type:complete len:110 (-),score=25.62 GHUV01051308.1:69-398(-)